MKIGAYAIERDYSHYIAYAAKTIFAVVGTATKGPIGEAVVCTSAQDLVDKFGSLKPGCHALYAGQYFLSQSSKLYFVRAATSEAKESQVTISGVGTDTSTAVEDALVLQSTDKGTYADGYSVIVSKGVTEGKYNITIKSTNGYTIEALKDVSIAELKDATAKSFTVKSVSDAATALDLGTYTFAGGNDGIADIQAAEYINAAKALESDIVDMNLFAVPGVSDAAVVTAMLALAETRGDCLYLVDPPEGLTRDGVAQWHNGAGEFEHTAFNSSFGALYYDWVQIYDSINKVKVTVPPSVVVAATYAYSDRISEIWYAPAGLQRGIVRGVLDSTTKLSKPDVDYLYSENNSVNSLYDDPRVGLVVWGQKTLLRADTALNRVNVRRLLNYLKRVITAACNYLTFEPNDRVTWNSFEMKILPTLKNIQDKRGIYEYRIVKGETIVTAEDIDNYRMPCMIMIRPTKAAEEIPIYFVLTSTGADFNEVLEMNGVVPE